MKTHRSIEIGAIGEYKIRVIERRDINVSECSDGIWVNATLECAAIVINRGTKKYAFDINGRELARDQVPD